jgi:adenylate kinase
MNIVLLGAPGSGKGTQADMIAEKYTIPHISTGDLFREMAKKKSKLAVKIKAIMNSGALVPDEIVIEVLKNRIKKSDCKKGLVLDGFPRNMNQAKLLSNITKINHVVYLDVPSKEIIKRLSSRRQCKKCGFIYGLEVRSKHLDKCDKCGGEVYQRDDDKAATVKKRLSVYAKETKPIVNYYKKSKLLRKIDGSKSIEHISGQIRQILG